MAVAHVTCDLQKAAPPSRLHDPSSVCLVLPVIVSPRLTLEIADTVPTSLPRALQARARACVHRRREGVVHRPDSISSQ